MISHRLDLARQPFPPLAVVRATFVHPLSVSNGGNSRSLTGGGHIERRANAMHRVAHLSRGLAPADSLRRHSVNLGDCAGHTDIARALRLFQPRLGGPPGSESVSPSVYIAVVAVSLKTKTI